MSQIELLVLGLWRISLMLSIVVTPVNTIIINKEVILFPVAQSAFIIGWFLNNRHSFGNECILSGFLMCISLIIYLLVIYTFSSEKCLFVSDTYFWIASLSLAGLFFLVLYIFQILILWGTAGKISFPFCGIFLYCFDDIFCCARLSVRWDPKCWFLVIFPVRLLLKVFA